MSTHFGLLRYTQPGIQNVVDSPTMIANAKKLFQSMGAELKHWYLAMGQYDAIFIAEAPDDETIAMVTIALGMQGNFQTQTLRAFDEEEFGNLLDGLMRGGG